VTELEEENSILRAKVDGIENKFVRDVEDEARGEWHREHPPEDPLCMVPKLARAVLDAAVEEVQLWDLIDPFPNGKAPKDAWDKYEAAEDRTAAAVRAYVATRKEQAAEPKRPTIPSLKAIVDPSGC
jgi:hypothetical protein